MLIALSSIGSGAFLIGRLGGGLVWGLLALAGVVVAVAVFFVGILVWDRSGPPFQTSPGDSPTDLAELDHPKTATEEAAVLLEYVRDILARARLSEDDRYHLADLKQHLEVRDAGAQLATTVAELGPYDRNEAVGVMVAELTAEQLLTGGGGTRRAVPEWTPPSAAEREALSWFQTNVFRIVDADYEVWSGKHEQPERRGRRRRLPTDIRH